MQRSAIHPDLPQPRLAPGRRVALGLGTVLLSSVWACADTEVSAGEENATASLVADVAPVQGPSTTVTILTTNAADIAGPLGAEGGPTQGEWSFAAWVEVEDRAFLFDTGWSPDNVLRNAEILGIDLSSAEDLVLSHHHGDHTGGVETLRRELMARNPKALSRIHVAAGMFDSRPGPEGGERNPMVAVRERLEATGAEFVLHEGPTEIAPSVWVTGPVERVHPEQNYPIGPRAVVLRGDDEVPDVIPESQSLVVLARGGPVVVSGCGHAGLINTLDQTAASISADTVQAAIGGFHLFAASDEVLDWTAEQLAERRVGQLLGSHCTGLDSVYRIRQAAGLSRETAKVGAIGTRYVAAEGIIPGNINR